MEEVVKVLLSQTPEVVDQLVLIEKINCIGWFTFCLVLLAILKFIWTQSKNIDEEAKSIIRFLVCVIWFFILLGLVINPINYLQAIYAPKAVAIKILLDNRK